MVGIRVVFEYSFMFFVMFFTFRCFILSSCNNTAVDQTNINASNRAEWVHIILVMNFI